LRSKITKAFLERFKRLPKEIRKEARKSYGLWKANPQHPSLNFEDIKISANKTLWSVRVTQGYRVLGIRPVGDLIVWEWIGTHADYEKQIKP
jgi:hypothetical protein